MPVKSKEFDVVIMAAGRGSRLSEIVQRKPKCLLPVGNFCMLYFPLKLFEHNGFTEIFLAVLEMDKIVVESVIEKMDIHLKVNVITIPDDKDLGTADTLRYMHSYFTHDVIVASCDLVTNIDLNKVFQLYRKSDCSITAVYYPFKKDSGFILPGRSPKATIEKDIVALIPNSNELVLVGTASEFGETINISHNIIKTYKNIQLRSDLQDAHLYILKKAIINFLLLNSDNDMSTLKGDVLPFVVKKQSSTRNKYAYDNKADVEDIAQLEVGDHRAPDTDTLVELCKQPEYAVEAARISSYNDNRNDLRIASVRPIKCCAYITDTETILIRTNTMYGYCLANKMGNKFYKQLPGLSTGINVSNEAEIESTKVEKSTCIVGVDTKILSNVTLKTTNVGSRCLLKANSRISNCIIMDDVTVDENCILNNCVICDNVIINSGSELKNCIVSGNQTIAANSSFSKDVLSDLDNIMEI